MNKKRLFLLLILFLVIGFAAVSTTLILNGTIKIGESDFKVVFSEAYINGRKDDSLITSEKTLEFDINLDTEGEEYIIDYVVLNKSTDYAADISLKYTGETSEYLSIKNEFDDYTPLEAKKVRDGKITITLIKPTTEDLTINISYEISANALERDIISQYEEEISYLENDENRIKEAKELLYIANNHISEMIHENNEILYQLDSISDEEYTDDTKNTLNTKIDNINNLSNTANYADKNLINGSMEEPLSVKLETTELIVPVYEINSSTLGLDNVREITLAEAKEAAQNASNNLWNYRSELSEVTTIIESVSSTIDSKKDALYRLDTDEEVKDEIILASASEILNNIRKLQNLTYSWVRNEGYITNQYLTNEFNGYVNSINMIVDNTNFKGINLLDGTYKDIPNPSTHHLGLNNEELFFNLSSKENVALTRSHLEYAVSKLKNYAKEDYIYNDDLIFLRNERYAIENAINYIIMAEEPLTEYHAILQRMNELQGKLLNEYYAESDIEYLKAEQRQLLDELDRISNETKWNNTYIFNGIVPSITFEFGRREEVITQKNISINTLGLSNLLNEDISKGSELLVSAIYTINIYNSYFGSLVNSYNNLLNCVDSQIEVLSNSKSEEETKKELAETTIKSILNTLNRCKELVIRANNDTTTEVDAENMIEEATHEIRMIDMMVDDARVNGQEILNGTYNNIPNLRSDYLGINDTKLSFKSETESDLDKNIETSVELEGKLSRFHQ